MPKLPLIQCWNQSSLYHTNPLRETARRRRRRRKHCKQKKFHTLYSLVESYPRTTSANFPGKEKKVVEKILKTPNKQNNRKWRSQNEQTIFVRKNNWNNGCTPLGELRWEISFPELIYSTIFLFCHRTSGKTKDKCDEANKNRDIGHQNKIQSLFLEAFWMPKGVIYRYIKVSQRKKIEISIKQRNYCRSPNGGRWWNLKAWASCLDLARCTWTAKILH